jgi:Carboxypeptidase regulatory-like domain
MTMRSTRKRRIGRSIGQATMLVAFMAFHPHDAAAQVTLHGRALDPSGAPVPSIEVLMHRVAGGSGANVARDTTDANGEFTLTADVPAGDTAVYFAATRYRDQLFVGDFVKPPFDAQPTYTLEVGGEPFSMSSSVPVSSNGTTPAMPQPALPARQRWLIALLPILGLAGLAFWSVTRLTQPPRERRLLLRIATIDEAGDEVGDGSSRERDRLMEQLLSG